MLFLLVRITSIANNYYSFTGCYRASSSIPDVN